jgi:hypothetical protein
MLIARAVILSPHSNRSSATNTVSIPPEPTPAIRICSSNESMCITTKLREVIDFCFYITLFFFLFCLLFPLFKTDFENSRARRLVHIRVMMTHKLTRQCDICRSIRSESRVARFGTRDNGLSQIWPVWPNLSPG